MSTQAIDLVRQERLAAIGEFAATIVHEIRNPLAMIVLSLSLVERQGVPAEAKRSLGAAFDEAARIDRLLRELLLYAKPYVLERRRVEIARLCRDVAGGLEARPELQGRSIELSASPADVVIEADPDKLRQVVTNLLLNAMEATPEANESGAQSKVSMGEPCFVW